MRQEGDNRAAELRELEALRPAPADAMAVGPTLSDIRAQVRLLETWAAAYDDLDFTRSERLQARLGVIAAKTADGAQAAGFQVCGQG